MRNTGPDIPAVAVIADAHFHDIEGDYDFEGLSIGKRRLTVRSWADTAKSTRVYNESFAALPAALEEISARGIRHVVLLGDYSDDGQRATTQSLVRLLRRWRDSRGLSFYAIPGNHDIFGPLGKHRSTRFTNASGTTTLVTSDAEIASVETRPHVLTSKMYCDGMPAGLLPMADFGLARNPAYLHWETPFGASDDLDLRQHDLRSADGQTVRRLVDASYLVEPAEGLWLLMIDANVFEPRDGDRDISRKKAFIDSSNAGWNAVLRVKPYLLDWIAGVSARADRLGKRLLAFSHYPAIDPFEDETGSEKDLFGETDIVRRTPLPAVAEALTQAGIRLHFSGHMHVAASSTRHDRSGTLTNIAVPSLVAFPAGFTVIDASTPTPKIETVSLASMPLDPDLLRLYRTEALERGGEPHPAAYATSYGAFLYRHMDALVTHRYLPRDWPAALRDLIPEMTLNQACLLMTGEPVDFHQANEILKRRAENRQLCDRLDLLTRSHGIETASLNTSSMLELIIDWYCLRQGAAQAMPFIAAEKLRLYRFMASTFANRHEPAHTSLTAFLESFLAVLDRSLKRAERDAS